MYKTCHKMDLKKEKRKRNQYTKKKTVPLIKNFVVHKI